MNKRQAKKLEKKKDLFYDTSQRSYREARKYYYWLHNQRISKVYNAKPNYWGEY